MTQLAEIQKLTRQGYETLQRRFPGRFELGGCLLLGRQYAHSASRAVVLGINPGLSPYTHLDVGRQSQDLLLDGPDGVRHQYFTNARRFFSASPVLLSTVRLATFSFCCPYRTASWSDLAPELRRALTDVSRPVLRQIISDCQPALVVVAGKDGFVAFVDTLGRTLQIERTISCGGSGGVYQWAAYETTYDGQRVTVAQVPHFSRANSRARLEECANWLEGLSPEAH